MHFLTLSSARSDSGAGLFIGFLLGTHGAAPQAAGHDDHTLASWALDAAFARGLPSPRFMRNGARLLAVSARRAGDRAGLDTAIGPSPPATTRPIVRWPPAGASGPRSRRRRRDRVCRLRCDLRHRWPRHDQRS